MDYSTRSIISDATSFIQVTTNLLISSGKVNCSDSEKTQQVCEKLLLDELWNAKSFIDSTGNKLLDYAEYKYIQQLCTESIRQILSKCEEEDNNSYSYVYKAALLISAVAITVGICVKCLKKTRSEPLVAEQHKRQKSRKETHQTRNTENKHKPVKKQEENSAQEAVVPLAHVQSNFNVSQAPQAGYGQANLNGLQTSNQPVPVAIDPLEEEWRRRKEFVEKESKKEHLRQLGGKKNR